jgi:hypothetical protein
MMNSTNRTKYGISQEGASLTADYEYSQPAGALVSNRALFRSLTEICCTL